LFFPIFVSSCLADPLGHKKPVTPVSAESNFCWGGMSRDATSACSSLAVRCRRRSDSHQMYGSVTFFLVWFRLHSGFESEFGPKQVTTIQPRNLPFIQLRLCLPVSLGGALFWLPLLNLMGWGGVFFLLVWVFGFGRPLFPTAKTTSPTYFVDGQLQNVCGDRSLPLWLIVDRYAGFNRIFRARPFAQAFFCSPHPTKP